MAYKEDETLIFPTRHGEPAGAGAERVMLDKAQGASGIVSVYRSNPDGSTTQLKTRMGSPQFVTDDVQGAVTEKRGFTARKPGKSDGFRINFAAFPKSAKTKYVGLCYVVGSAKTAINAKLSEGTLWSDVFVAIKNRVFINLRKFAQKTTDFYQIPFLVGATYTVAKLWLAGKESIVGSSTLPLTPTTPRTDLKALVGGQWVDSGTSEAPVVGMAQIWFSGMSWDDDGGDWGYSSSVYDLSALVPTETHHGHTLDIPGAAFSSSSQSGSGTDYVSLASVQLNANAAFAVQNISYFTSGNHGPYKIAYGNTFGGWIPATTRGRIPYSYENLTWEAPASPVVMAISPTETLTTTIENQLVISSRSGSPIVEANAGLPEKTGVASIEIRLDGGGVPYEHGRSNYTHGGGGDWWWTINVTGDSGFINYKEKTQVLNASVVLGSDVLLSLTGNYDKLTGTYFDISPIDLAPMTGVDANFFEVFVNGVLPEAPLGMSDVEANNWTMEKTTALSQGVVNAATEIMGQSGYFGINTLVNPTRATRHDHSYPGIGTFSQSWETKDYFLYDKQEDVFGWIAATCSGSGTDAAGPCSQTLTVSLHIDVRGSHYTKALGSWTFNSVDLFALIEANNTIADTYCIPTPTIRPFFLPPVRHQGAFSGVAYTTQAEETRGATPHSLMNFRLRLHMLGFVGPELNSEKGTNILNFIPYLLVEMLYGTIFSHWLGAHPDYRYPVFAATFYTQLANSLFGTEYHIHLFDGEDMDWASNLPGFPSKSDEIEVFRT